MLQRQLLQRIPHGRVHDEVAIGCVKVGAADVHGPVPPENHPGRDSAVDGRQVFWGKRENMAKWQEGGKVARERERERERSVERNY